MHHSLTMSVAPGETLMSAAAQAGYRWPSVCGGNAICGTCAARVVAGEENAPRPTDLDRRRLDELRIKPALGELRLACQLVPTGVMTVYKVGVRRVG